MTIHDRLQVSILSIAVVLCFSYSRAELIDCPAPDSSPYIVNLSEPQYTSSAFSTRDEMLEFFNRLHLHLDERRDVEMAGIRSIDFKVARCEGRVPKIDGTEFKPEIAEGMYADRVVVEIWGQLDKRTGSGSAKLEAQMNYLLVPIAGNIVRESQGVKGIHRFEYPDGDIVATDFVDLVSNTDLHAFVAGAVGLKAFDNEDFPLAHEMSCVANASLSRTEARLAASPETHPQSAKVAKLREFLRTLAGRSIEEAIETANRRSTPIPTFARLQHPADPCPTGVPAP